MVAEIWASVISSFVDQLVALSLFSPISFLHISVINYLMPPIHVQDNSLTTVYGIISSKSENKKVYVLQNQHEFT